MKTYKKSNLTTQHKTQNVITNVIKNIIEWLVSRSNIQKKHSDVLDAEVREKMKMTMDTLGKSINNLEVKINDVKKGLKNVRKSDGDVQKAKKDYETAKGKINQDNRAGKGKGGKSEEAKKARQRDLTSKHEEYQKQTQVYNSMQRHLQESTFPNIMKGQEAAYNVSKDIILVQSAIFQIDVHPFLTLCHFRRQSGRCIETQSISRIQCNIIVIRHGLHLT